MAAPVLKKIEFVRKGIDKGERKDLAAGDMFHNSQRGENS